MMGEEVWRNNKDNYLKTVEKKLDFQGPFFTLAGDQVSVFGEIKERLQTLWHQVKGIKCFYETADKWKFSYEYWEAHTLAPQI